jgi:isocitrate/isopropylmalate dehydrogenase
MMLRHLGDGAAAGRIEAGVMAAARERRTTRDLGGDLNTSAAADAVLHAVATGASSIH